MNARFPRLAATLLAASLCATMPAHAADAPEPARLGVATQIASAILPPGTYRKLMSGTFDAIMSQTMKQMEQIPMRDLVQSAGLDPKAASALGEVNLAQIMAIVDPAYDERMQRTTKAMMGQMVNILEQFEPTLLDVKRTDADAKNRTPGKSAFG